MNELNSITVTEIKEMFTVMSPHGKTAEITDRKYFGLSVLTGRLHIQLTEKKSYPIKTKPLFYPKAGVTPCTGIKPGDSPL